MILSSKRFVIISFLLLVMHFTTTSGIVQRRNYKNSIFCVDRSSLFKQVADTHPRKSSRHLSFVNHFASNQNNNNVQRPAHNTLFSRLSLKQKPLIVSSTSLSLSSFKKTRRTMTSTTSTEEETATISPVPIDSNTNGKPPPPQQKQQKIEFSHVQIFVDNLLDLKEYKLLENQLDEFVRSISNTGTTATETPSPSPLTMDSKQQLWNSILQNSSSIQHHQQQVVYTPQNRDLVKQLMVGFGFRITAAKYNDHTRSVLVTSRDPKGVQYLITAAASSTSSSSPLTSSLKNSVSSMMETFYMAHNGRQGIGVLAFLVDNVASIQERYKQLHPQLIVNEQQKRSDVLEVYAFYKPQNHDDSTNGNQQRDADTGTVLRFIEVPTKETASNPIHTIMDLDPIDHLSSSFIDPSSQPAYCDHWVSNVYERQEFLDTLYDTLQFQTKVDFNAGVVAAGEAQIESTVIGNTAQSISDPSTLLMDQTQVYLPINNALSNVGHVHHFLNEIGQGIQHIASRVPNLIDFVQRCNTYREITNEGFSFLKIPRSYYGVLQTEQFHDIISKECANEIITVLRTMDYLTKESAVQLHLTRMDLDTIFTTSIDRCIDMLQKEYPTKKDQILDVILQSRYCNLYSLLKDQISEEQYIGIVQNQILVDIQGDDLLYQIFTSNILQRNVGEEAPFLEFIQRVCGNDGNGGGVRPGCGGFGIRNFLTLFLSIEVSKAMQEVTDAIDVGDVERQLYAQSMVDCFTMQLNESNPILTMISDAMTEEGYWKHQLEMMKKKNGATTTTTTNEDNEWWMYEQKMNDAAAKKQIGNLKLMECSTRYKEQMKQIRESRK